jgi:hypothetical protein
MASEDLRSRLRDPWTVAPLLIALIGILALLFPKPQRVPEETDPERVRIPPPGMVLAMLPDALAVTCQKGAEPLKDCALLGAEGGLVYHLEATWSLDEVVQANKGRTLVVEGARLDLLENHADHYTGSVTVRSTAGGVLATGGRIDNRTLRAPLEGRSSDLDAEVARWLREGQGKGHLRVEADPGDSSSVDEYIPVLSFFCRAE